MGAQNKLKETVRLCVVIAAGEILDYAAVTGKIPVGAFVICADAGFLHCEALGVHPDLVVGDFDSLQNALPANIPYVTLSPDKNYTDTMLAVQEALSRGYTHLLLTGMLGGRADHAHANLQTLAYCANRGIAATLTDGITDVIPLCADGSINALTIPPRSNCYFSVLTMSEQCEAVTIKGAKYPLVDYTLRYDDPRAVSNEFLGRPVTISAKSGTLFIMITPK